jgi:hypothetical protein
MQGALSCKKRTLSTPEPPRAWFCGVVDGRSVPAWWRMAPSEPCKPWRHADAIAPQAILQFTDYGCGPLALHFAEHGRYYMVRGARRIVLMFPMQRPAAMQSFLGVPPRSARRPITFCVSDADTTYEAEFLLATLTTGPTLPPRASTSQRPPARDDTVCSNAMPCKARIIVGQGKTSREWSPGWASKQLGHVLLSNACGTCRRRHETGRRCRPRSPT